MRTPSISDSTSWYWNRVSATVAVPDSSLGVLRWVIGIYLLVFSAPHFAWIHDVPRGMFNPPILSLSYLIGGFPPAPTLLLLDLVALLALVAMTIGWKTRAATLTLATSRLIGGSFAYSFGKIDHDILLTALLFCMVIANWGRFHSYDARNRPSGEGAETSRRTRQGLALFATAVAFGFLTAGLPKLIGWVDGDLSTSGVLRWFYGGRGSLGRDQFLGGYLPGTPAIMLELGDYAAVALEVVAFGALLWCRRSWRLYLAIVALFHLSTILILNISFGVQVLTYLAFVNLRIFEPLMGRAWLKVVALALVLVAATWHVVARLGGFDSQSVLTTSFEQHSKVSLYAGLVACVLVAALLVRDAFGARTASGEIGERPASKMNAPVTDRIGS